MMMINMKDGGMSGANIVSYLRRKSLHNDLLSSYDDDDDDKDRF